MNLTDTQNLLIKHLYQETTQTEEGFVKKWKDFDKNSGKCYSEFTRVIKLLDMLNLCEPSLISVNKILDFSRCYQRFQN